MNFSLNCLSIYYLDVVKFMESKNNLSETINDAELLYNLLGSLYIKIKSINDIDLFLDKFMTWFDQPTKNLIKVLIEMYWETLNFCRCDLINFYANDLQYVLASFNSSTITDSNDLNILILKISKLWSDADLRQCFMSYMHKKSKWYYDSIADLDIGDIDLEYRFNPDKCMVVYQ